MNEEIKDPRKDGQLMRCDLWADDLHVCLIWGNGRVKATVHDTSDLPADSKQAELDLSTEEAGALAFLFVAGDDYIDTDVLEQLYGLLEPTLVNVPKNLRPIP